MTPVKASSFGHRIAFCRRYPGGRRSRSILRTVSRAGIVKVNRLEPGRKAS